MAFESLKAGIYLLLDEIENRPGDRLELEEELREQLAELEGFGLPLPEDLVQLRERLAGEGDTLLPDGASPAAADTGDDKGNGSDGGGLPV